MTEENKSAVADEEIGALKHHAFVIRSTTVTTDLYSVFSETRRRVDAALKTGKVPQVKIVVNDGETITEVNFELRPEIKLERRREQQERRRRARREG